MKEAIKNVAKNFIKSAQKNSPHSSPIKTATNVKSLTKKSTSTYGSYLSREATNNSNSRNKTINSIIPCGVGFAGMFLGKALRDSLNKSSHKVKINLKAENPEDESSKLRDYFFDKIKHDNNTPKEKLDEIHNTFTDFFKDIDKNKTLKDIMEISSKEDTVSGIHLFSNSNGDDVAEFDIENKNINIYGVSNSPPKFILESFVHECSHSVQYLFADKVQSYENPFENGVIESSYDEDDYDARLQNEEKKDLNQDLSTYYHSQRSYEIHARMMEKLLYNKKETEKNFPSTIRQSEKTHDYLKKILKDKPSSYTKRVMDEKMEDTIIEI